MSSPGATVDPAGCEADGDGDGVGDLLDHCPNTVAGARVDWVGCEIDGDCDGVGDHRDRCPRTRIGARVDEVGCEVAVTCADEDADQVCDRDDRCRGTPPGVSVDQRGCDVLRLDGVHFATDSSALTEEARQALDAAIASLARRGYPRLIVAGHTDSRHDAAYNQRLSQARAEAVRDYLIQHGMPAHRVTAVGYGESRPIADNDTEPGRAKNRRVELQVEPSDAEQ